MEVKLVKPWRFYEDGCRQVDYKAGVVDMPEAVIKIAEQCGVIEKKGKKVEAQPKEEVQAKSEN